MSDRTDQPTTRPSPTPWPPGITARYLTTVDALVDLRLTDTPGLLSGGCSGSCDWTLGTAGTLPVAAAHRQAQQHAATCRALLRPPIAAPYPCAGQLHPDPASLPVIEDYDDGCDGFNTGGVR